MQKAAQSFGVIESEFDRDYRAWKTQSGPVKRADVSGTRMGDLHGAKSGRVAGERNIGAVRCRASRSTASRPASGGGPTRH